MSDSLGNGEGDSTEAQTRLYERWSEGGAAVSIIGEVQGDPRYPEKPDTQRTQDLVAFMFTLGTGSYSVNFYLHCSTAVTMATVVQSKHDAV